MYRIVGFCLVLFLFCSFKIGAQNIKVESFTRLETDITARVNVVRDANDDECALIKMVTTDVGYDMDESLKRESRVGEIWFYVPQGTKRIVIRHQKLGKLVYALPETLKAKTTYQIKLPSNVEIIVHEDAGGQYLVMTVQPSDALVYVNDVLETTKAGKLSKMFKYGEHAYRIEHPLYETKTGVFTIKDKKEQLTVNLTPAYGYLSFSSTPTGAEVTMNGKILGRTPFKSEALREGAYRVKTSLATYSEDVREVTVVRGQTQEVAIPLNATFGYMEVNTTPEKGADVYINDMKVGKTPYRSNKLAEGTYKLKVIQQMYAPQEREVQIVKGQTQQVVLNMNASFAEVVIRSEQPQAAIYVNNEKKGLGEWKGRLTEGFYQISSRMESHRDGTKSVEVKAGIPQTIVIPAPTAIYGTLNITSEPTDGVIRIDGKEMGRTPELISNVLIGERKIEIERQGCAVVSQTVMIEEGKVKDLNIRLSQGKEIAFETYTPATIEIDGVDVGNASFKGMLSYGEHTLKVKESADGIEVNEVFKVTESSPTEFLVRNGKFESKYGALIDGVHYSPSSALTFGDDKIDGIYAHDYYTDRFKKLPLPNNDSYMLFFDDDYCGDIQGYLGFSSGYKYYIWKGGKWEIIDRYDRGWAGIYIVFHNGHGYLYALKMYEKHFDIIRIDVLTAQNQVLFSYDTKLYPYGKFTVVDDTHLRFKGDFWTKKKDGGIKKCKEPFDFCIRIDSLPLPPVMKRSALIDKMDEQIPIIERERERKKVIVKSGIDQIDWKSFPGYSGTGKIYIVDKTAYVEIKQFNRLKWYEYDFERERWNNCTSNPLLNKVSEWKEKGQPNLPSYCIDVDYIAKAKGLKITIDSKYQHDTRYYGWTTLK